MKYIAYITIFLLMTSFTLAVESTKVTNEDLAPKFLRSMSVNNNVQHCYQANESYAVYHNGLWWAWLAPVAQNGWGNIPDASLIGDGWRNVANDEEWALRPDPSAFGGTKCAAVYFFPGTPWCDWNDPYHTDETHPNGYLTYTIDGSLSEFWVVHDDCNGVEIPEFGLLGLMVAIIGGIITFTYIRKH